MFVLKYTGQFKKDLKRYKHQTKAIQELRLVLNSLSAVGVEGLPKKNNSHRLKGEYKDNWECHVLPDLLLIWIQVDEDLVIKLVRLGSHSELFLILDRGG